MRSEISIKLEYLEDRQNPSEVFEAIALYINAYSDLGQMLSNSIGIKDDFELQLNGIEKSSILSKLSVIPRKIDEKIEIALYGAGYKLFEELASIEETKTEEQVEELAIKLESNLVKNLSNKVVDPYIDRKELAYVLESFSAANQKILPNETVIFSDNTSGNQAVSFNTKWRFLGKAKEMFLGKTEHQEFTDRLYIAISVNEGNSIWSFRSLASNERFSARIMDKEWLEKYQSGLIPPIGPKDFIEAQISLDLYTPPKGKSKPQIRNAKLMKINKIQRNFDLSHQYELDT